MISKVTRSHGCYWQDVFNVYAGNEVTQGATVTVRVSSVGLYG